MLHILITLCLQSQSREKLVSWWHPWGLEEESVNDKTTRQILVPAPAAPAPLSVYSLQHALARWSPSIQEAVTGPGGGGQAGEGEGPSREELQVGAPAHAHAHEHAHAHKHAPVAPAQI